MSLNYLRVYTGDDGETYFEDVQLPAVRRSSGVSSSFSDYAPAIDVDELILREVVVEHGDDEFHNTPRRQFVIHLAGEVELTVSSGETRRVAPGDVVLVEDVSGRGHITRSIGGQKRKTVFITLRG